MIQQLLLIFHVLVAVALVGLVLIQHGKGADMGASFGSAGSQALFGGRGAGSFLTRATGVLATIFFVTSISLAYTGAQQAKSRQVFDIPTSAPVSIPQETGQLSEESAFAVEVSEDGIPVVADTELD